MLANDTTLKPDESGATPEKGSTIIGWIILLVWSMALLLLAYGSSLSMPFMADDFFQFPFVENHTLGEIWRTADDLYYFRPVAFSFWKISQLIFGYHHAWFLHAGNLLFHLANALLVAWLADRLWQAPAQGGTISSGWTRRFIAASLFLLFPFSYEAVPWISAVMHPAMVTLVLLSVTGYLKLRHERNISGIIWGCVGLLAAFLAPFAHENGALALPLLAAVEITRPKDPQKSSLQRLGLLALWVFPLLLWFLIWRLEPKSIGTGGTSINDLSLMLLNSVYFLQAAAFPITWFGVLVSRLSPFSDVATITLLSLFTLVVMALVQWSGRGGRRSLLPWLWILISSSSAVALLSFPYLQAAPRVLMLAAVGIVWLWVDVLCLLPRLLTRFRLSLTIGKIIMASLLGIILFQSFIYIRQQMRTYEAGGDLVWDIVDKTAAANQAGHTAVFANLPTWLALPRTYYAIGEEGAMLMPSASKMDTLVSVHTGQPARIQAIEHAATRQEMPYYHGLVAVNPDWQELAESGVQIFSTRYITDTLFAQPVGSIEMVQDQDFAQPAATFGDCLALQGANSAYSEGDLAIELMWQRKCEVPPEYTVFVHILDDNGGLAAQVDGDPLSGILPFAAWPENTVTHDIRYTALETRPSAVSIGLYDRYTGERLPGHAAAGSPLIDHALQIPLSE